MSESAGPEQVSAPPTHGWKRLRRAFVADFRSASWPRRFALVAVVGWLLYEWGAGNETLTPWIIAKVIKDSHGAISIPVTAGIGFGFTTLQQLASGFTALTGFSIFDRTAEAAWQRLRGQDETAPIEWTRLTPFRRCAVVFGLGTTAVALIQIMSTGKIGIRRHAKAVIQSAALCGTIVGSIGGTAASLAVLGRHVHALRTPTEWILRILGNPLFWVGLLLLGFLSNAIRRGLGKRNEG
jgi:hypothetical protein